MGYSRMRCDNCGEEIEEEREIEWQNELDDVYCDKCETEMEETK